MSEHNEDVWAEFASHSRRIINLEQRMLERLLALEAEVKALKAKPETLQGRIDRETALEMSQEEYQKLIMEIMQQ
jgi:cell division septum initiation protein DivIVA